MQLVPAGLEWIREVHAKTIQDKRPVVIIHDEADEIDLPDKQDEAAFSDVYMSRGTRPARSCCGGRRCPRPTRSSS